MKLAFEQDNVNRRIMESGRASGRERGDGGLADGGIIALLLDEAMGKVCRFRDVRAVTAELTVEYLKPVKVENEIARGVATLAEMLKVEMRKRQRGVRRAERSRVALV